MNKLKKVDAFVVDTAKGLLIFVLTIFGYLGIFASPVILVLVVRDLLVGNYLGSLIFFAIGLIFFYVVRALVVILNDSKLDSDESDKK